MTAANDPRPESQWQLDRDALLDADRAFYEASRARDLEGWLAFFADDAVDLVEGVVLRGTAAIADQTTPHFGDESSEVRWFPLDADVSAEGLMGFTFGRWQLVRKESTHVRVTSAGTYATVWKRGEDGRWRVALRIDQEQADAVEPAIAWGRRR